MADQRKAKFHQAEGDHLTLLTVFNAWKNNKFSDAWCFENFVQARTLKRALDVRKQMLGIMDRHKLDVVSCGKNTVRVQKAICSGFFRNTAKKDPQEGYRTLADNQTVFLHPSSCLYQRQPDWLVVNSMLCLNFSCLANRNRMRGRSYWLQIWQELVGKYLIKINRFL